MRNDNDDIDDFGLDFDVNNEDDIDEECLLNAPGRNILESGRGSVIT